jgi:hypothetical protein
MMIGAIIVGVVVIVAVGVTGLIIFNPPTEWTLDTAASIILANFL